MFKSIIPNYNKKFIVQYLTDVDFYKLTMLQFIFHQFFDVKSKYNFKNRTKEVNLCKYIDQIKFQFDNLCELKFQDFELKYLEKIPYFKKDFIDFLKNFQLKRDQIDIYIQDGELIIETKEERWCYVMMFEIYTLIIVEEIYTRNEYKDFDLSEGRNRLQNKIDMILNYVENVGRPFPVVDFGTRRRFSLLWQEEVIFNLSSKLPKNVFLGTSNILFAILYDLKPIGTMAHEVIEAGQALTLRPIDGQIFILNKWLEEYKGELGIALTDTLGFDKFLKDFDDYFSKEYDGGRHDSNNPFIWVDKFIDHYKKFNIDPMSKLAGFSDGLNIPLCIKLADYCYNRIKYFFGVGTNFTNDVGILALQVVMKIVRCNNKYVAKVADVEGKGMSESKEYESYLKEEIKKDLEQYRKVFSNEMDK